MKILCLSCSVQDGSHDRRRQALMGMIDRLEKILASDKETDEMFVFDIDDKYRAFMVTVQGCEESSPSSMAP